MALEVDETSLSGAQFEVCRVKVVSELGRLFDEKVLLKI